jgi:alpha-ketoglutarate-dependent taurine dioxygenase
MLHQEISERLDSDGWCAVFAESRTTDELCEEIRLIGQTFGEIAPGRHRQLVERIVPRNVHASYRASLSATYGLGPLPLHTDTAHWSTPCRYLLMACANVGLVPTCTTLLNIRDAHLSELESAACSRALFLVRNGRRSFYGTIAERDRKFIRFDPGCMMSLSYDGDIALAALTLDRQRTAVRVHEWRFGDILMIDNWQVLHGRGMNQHTDRGRVLLRVMVR